MSWPWPFDTEYMRLALLAGVIVGAVAPLIGAFLVQKRLSLFGDGVGHLAFAGVAGGLALNIWPVWTAFIIAVFGATGIEALRSSKRVAADVVLAVFFYGGIAAGVVIISRTNSLNGSILSYLFGSILTVTIGDVLITLIFGVVIVGTLACVHRALFAIVIDEEVAQVAGLPVKFMNYLLAVMAALTVVAAMRVVGLLLVAAMLVLPVAAAQQIATSFRRTVILSVAIGVLSVIVGLTAARAFDVAPGGTIVLTIIGFYAVLGLVSTVRRQRDLPAAPPASARHSAHT